MVPSGGGAGGQNSPMAGAELVVARNPDAASSLPFLIRVPLGFDGVVLKVRDRWPRTAKVFCHPETVWPHDAEIIERVPVRSCVLPSRRSAAGPLVILVDAREQHPWRFSHQQAETVRRTLPAGDYAVEHDGALMAVVERKSLADLASSATTGRLRYLLADLAALPRAAVVVEDRYSSVFRLTHVRPAVVADGIAESQVRYPTVPIVFAESRRLAEGLPVSERGRLRPEVWDLYRSAHVPARDAAADAGRETVPDSE